MMYHGYKIDRDYISGGSIKWQVTGCGEYVSGVKDGRKYFIKRNTNVCFPCKGYTKAVYDIYKAESDKFVNRQKNLRRHMAGLSCEKDHIAVQEESFIDKENKFTIVTDFIPDTLPKDFDYSKLSLAEFLNLCKEVALSLKKLHVRDVIHGDIKEGNILVVNKDGFYIPYLKGFDSAYIAGNVPEWDNIGGAEGYQSPEVLLYGSGEDAVNGNIITAATDIFSLALVMHRWWTGVFPDTDSDMGSVGAAVYLDKTVITDNKFNIKIGGNYGVTLMSLMNWMLAKTPQIRPSAEKVSAVLSDKADVPEEYRVGIDKGVRRKTIDDDGGREGLTVESPIKSDYTKDVDVFVDVPWEEHGIEFVSSGKVSAKGYRKIEKVLISYRKRYLLTTNSGMQFNKGCDWLIKEGLANLKVGQTDCGSPWPEDGARYVPENMSGLGIKSISRLESGGEHRYKIVYYEVVDGENKSNENVSGKNLKIMGVIK